MASALALSRALVVARRHCSTRREHDCVVVVVVVVVVVDDTFNNHGFFCSLTNVIWMDLHCRCDRLPPLNLSVASKVGFFISLLFLS
jgi:uncharacterized membrane protein YobD (UPF0266 family)